MSRYILSDVLGSKYAERLLVALYELVEHCLIKKYLIGKYHTGRELFDVSDKFSAVLLLTGFFEKENIAKIKCLDRGLIFEKFIGDDFYTYEFFYVRSNENTIDYATILEMIDYTLERELCLTVYKLKIMYQNCNMREVDYEPHFKSKLLKVMVRFFVIKINDD